MEYLDQIGFDTNVGSRSRRVRSWYLNEHVKSFETKRCASASISKLENRHYQDRMLQKELAERRIRRRLYDHPDDTESQISHSLGNEDSENISRENLYESICSFEDDENKYRESEHESVYDRSEQNYNVSLSEEVQPTMQSGIHERSSDAIEEQNEVEVQFTEIKSAIPEEKSLDKSNESVNSVIKMETPVKETYEELIPVELDPATNNHTLSTSSTLKKQPINNFIPNNTLEVNMRPMCNKPVKETIRTSETKTSGFITPSEEYLLNRLDCASLCGKAKDTYVCKLWSKVVSFAYQLVKSNQGIIYDDCSAQIMTAVLACEVMRRGVTKICDMLQPYVSPIKFSSEKDLTKKMALCDNANYLTKTKRKKFAKPRKKYTYSRSKRKDHKSVKSVPPDESEATCDLLRPPPSALRPKCLGIWSKSHTAQWSNKPWDFGSDQLTRYNTTSSSSLWPYTRPDLYNRKVENPMLKLVTYVDEILQLDEEGCSNDT